MLRLCTILLSLLPVHGPAGGPGIATAGPAPLCTSLQVRVIAPPLAPLARISRQRIDCGAFLHGRPRKVELVFRDTRLDLAWVVFPAEDREAFLAAFTARYGKPALALGYGGVYVVAGATVHRLPAVAPSASSPQARAMLALRQVQAVAAPIPLPST
ncbi:MAG: hypothetical protein J7507_12440 [Pseudoxanthomonas sp.]|nr:hypothetical protein [Pseudoxanthomonas sp.]